MQQTHHDLIGVVSEKDINLKNSTQPFVIIPQLDAMITKSPQLVLLIKSADCLPITIYHPSGLIAGVHASRKNTDLHILEKTFQTIAQKFNLKSDFEIYFGPHIQEKCYQIDRATDTHYSLIKHNQDQLDSVLGSNNYTLEISSDCTHCQPQLYSYRAEGPGLRMNYTAISL